MALRTILFYLLALLIVGATAMAITRRHAVHAVCYLIVSFLGTALVFYLLGAPLLAVLEVIIYAGAIMVLFIFIVMMLTIEAPTAAAKAVVRQWLPGIVLGVVSFAGVVILIAADPGSRLRLKTAVATPKEFGLFLFHNYWYPVEIVSFLLFVALVGALYLGRRGGKTGKGEML